MKKWREKWSVWKEKAPWFFLLALATVVSFAWYAFLHENRQRLLSVSFLYIGQGDAILIEAPNGNQMIVDGGPDGSLLRRLGEFLPFYDRSIDALLVTNPDKDHFAGFIDILNRFSVGKEIEPGTFNPSAIYATLEAVVKQKQVPQILVHTGDRIVLDRAQGVVLDILYPDRDVSALATNEGSIVAKLSYGNTCFMLMGDAPQGVEEYLVRLYGAQLNCQVLKAGHHGSRTSTSPVFVQDVAPEYAVISDGKNNKYGHPHKETLNTLNTAGVKILRTDELGSITFTTDGRLVSLKEK